MATIQRGQLTLEECYKRRNKKRKLSESDTSANADSADATTAPSTLSGTPSVSAVPMASTGSPQSTAQSTEPPALTDGIELLLAAATGSSGGFSFSYSLPTEACHGPVHSQIGTLASLLADIPSDCSPILEAISRQLKTISSDLKQNYVLKTGRSLGSGADAKQVLPLLRSVCDRIKSIEHDVRSIKSSTHRNPPPLSAERSQPSNLHLNGGRVKGSNNNLDSLCILSKVSAQTASKAQRVLLENPLVSQNKVAVEYFNVHPSGNVYVHCRSPKDADMVGSILGKAGIAARGVIKKRPRYLVTPLPFDVVDSDFLTWLESADSRFASHKGSAVIKRLKLNPAQCALVLEVDHDLGCLLDQNPSLVYRLRRVRLSRFFDLLQCRYCCRYGHTDRHCRFRHTRSYCTTCGGPDCGLGRCHNESSRSCANCARLGHSDTSHASWDKSCIHRKERIRCLSPPSPS